MKTFSLTITLGILFTTGLCHANSYDYLADSPYRAIMDKADTILFDLDRIESMLENNPTEIDTLAQNNSETPLPKPIEKPVLNNKKPNIKQKNAPISYETAPIEVYAKPEFPPKKIIAEIISEVETLQTLPDPYPVHEENEFLKDLTEPTTTYSSNIKGEIKMGVGVDSDGFYWKRANFDLNERNFRIISDDQLNNKENTFDPGLYSRLKLNVDIDQNDSPLKFHSLISIDPWSFTAKSEKTIITGAGGDRAEIELLYWSNTGYTVNQIVNTLDNGDGFALSEMKVDGIRTIPTTITSTFTNVFTIPELKLKRQFQPIRELWLDYTPSDNFKLRVFPMAFQTAALTSDDPLRLSNNQIFWEESPWLASWKPGNFNSAGAGDFTKGKWDDNLAFFTRDSDGTRLTALRGISLEMDPSVNTSIKATVATPKDLWQDYQTIRSLPSSIRVKHFLSDDFYLGGISNLHLGFNDNKRDAYNYVTGLDGGIKLYKNLKLDAQLSTSFSKQDITNSIYATKKRGNAYFFSLTTTSLTDGMIGKNFGEIAPFNQKVNYHKNQLFYARMDDGFESSLSNYRETRDDSYWGRHLHFRRPMNEFFGGGGGMTWYDIKPFAVGNGIDINRFVFGWNSEISLWAGRLKGQTDIRNVHSNENKFIENVARTEWTHKTTDKLDTKLLLINHKLPNTKAGIDPFITDPNGKFLINTAIEDGKDPSVNTVSLGTQYDITDKITWNGIWEYTNDLTAATDNFPRGLLNSSSFETFEENALTFRRDVNFLYGQGSFDLPPYEYLNIFKTGLNVRPIEKVDIYLNYTRNPNKFAGQIDDSMNQIGFEATYLPTSKLGIFFKYTRSQSYDLFTLVNDQRLSFETHHNFFSELRYKMAKDEHFTFQYGVGPSPVLSSSTFDPFGGAMLSLDTQHIFRAYYQRSF
ncbi:hypothetical protein MNBD_UNCLBAC01-1269 [hydrothermal vent metagenome]|uniref:Uncharacterized protein n=1 Tax=hydrothermal vent metagenome TaxID=652676 RepID=A0A3B1DX12_9ZZZZ